jgi:hypothetical protein
MYVSSVSHGYCKNRSGCCICCYGCMHMLQAFVPNVSSVFQIIWTLHMFTHMLQVFYLDVAYVCNGFQLFFQVFQMNISSVLFVFFML